LLLTFMVANYNVLASISCMSGCGPQGFAGCQSTSTTCSDGEICSKFKIESMIMVSQEFRGMVEMQCMTIEDCKTNQGLSQSDLLTAASNLKALTRQSLTDPSGKIEFACCNQNDCNSKPVSEMKNDEVEGDENEVEASGAGGIFENHLMFYMALGSIIIYFSS